MLNNNLLRPLRQPLSGQLRSASPQSLRYLHTTGLLCSIGCPRQSLSGSGRHQPSASVSFLSIHSASLIMVSSSKGLPRPALSTRLGKSMVPLSLHRRR